MIESDRLFAAVAAFARYGYRKTSMDDVAAAMGVSRQALYKKYASKEALFRALAEALVAHVRQAALDALADDARPLQDRIVAALDQQHGQFVDMLRASPHSAEITDAADSEIRDIAMAAEADIAGAIAKLLGRRSKWTADAAFTLLAASKGLMVKAPSHDAYLNGIKRAVSTYMPGRR